MFYRVDPSSNPPSFKVYDSDPNLATLKAKPLNCGLTSPMNLPGAKQQEVQHTICNTTGNNITVNIIKA